MQALYMYHFLLNDWSGTVATTDVYRQRRRAIATHTPGHHPPPLLRSNNMTGEAREGADAVSVRWLNACASSTPYP
jgi:hypothetical protein